MNNEMFFTTCPICNNGNIQCLNDNKGHHQALCSSNTIARKNIHDSIVNAFMYFFKSVGILALKEALDVLTKINHNGEILVPDMFLTNSPFSENNPDSAFDVYVVHPSNNSLSSKTTQKISKYHQSNEIANGNTIFIPVGFDLYGKLRSETTKLIDDIALLVLSTRIVKNATFLIDFIIICHSFLQLKMQILLNLIFLNMVNLDLETCPQFNF
jgi:hypothetical protein